MVMLGNLLQGIGDLLGESLLEMAFYIIGRIVIPGVSFGHWHCMPALSSVRKQDRRWVGLIHRRTDGIYFTSGGTAAVGGAVCLLVAAGALLLWYFRQH